MTQESEISNAPFTYRAVLMPYRSLGPSGFLILMIFISLVSFIAGVAFLLMGAWPVFGFFGLDVLLIYGAFKLNYRSGRLFEVVELSPEMFTITRHHPSGRQEAFAFDPYWSRLRLEEGRDGRTDLRVHVRGREVSFGQFLTDDERRIYADELRCALIDARGGVRI